MIDNQTRVILYGALWCPDARRSRKLLDAKDISYEWHDIDQEPSAKDFVKQSNNGQVVLPTIVFPDGSMLVEPSDEELLKKLKTYSG